MFKFVHRKQAGNPTNNSSKIIVYYSSSEIFLGILLVIMTSFFIYNYLNTQLNQVNHVTPFVVTPVNSAK